MVSTRGFLSCKNVILCEYVSLRTNDVVAHGLLGSIEFETVVGNLLPSVFFACLIFSAFSDRIKPNEPRI
jgi:ABC-type anion transport system duplicated permease subunit